MPLSHALIICSAIVLQVLSAAAFRFIPDTVLRCVTAGVLGWFSVFLAYKTGAGWFR